MVAKTNRLGALAAVAGATLVAVGVHILRHQLERRSEDCYAPHLRSPARPPSAPSPARTSASVPRASLREAPSW
jgi:hypothetical protein